MNDEGRSKARDDHARATGDFPEGSMAASPWGSGEGPGLTRRGTQDQAIRSIEAVARALRGPFYGV